MKSTLTLLVLTFATAIAAFAQTSDDAAIRALIASYDNAYRTGDVSFLEMNLAPEYSITNNGNRRDRATTIAEARSQKASPTEKLVDFRSTVDDVRVAGDMAVASGGFFWKGSAPSDPNAMVHVDTGRFTMVFTKKGGLWLISDEHYSDAKHDTKMLEDQVLKMGLLYGEAIKRGDVKAYESFLADDYEFTNEKGQLVSRADDLRHFAARTVKINSAETLEHEARWISGSVVLETGVFRVNLTTKDGKRETETGRFTTVWHLRDLRWKIVSDHITPVVK